MHMKNTVLSTILLLLGPLSWTDVLNFRIENMDEGASILKPYVKQNIVSINTRKKQKKAKYS